MKALKAIAIIMVVLVVAAAGIIGYFYATATVRISAFKAEGAQAVNQAERFAAVKASVEKGGFIGTRFTDEVIGEADDYAFITYTVRLRNDCLAPIDTIELQITPVEGDVLQIGDLSVHSLAARSEGDLTATILTEKGNHSIRELVVTFYMWGVSFQIKETYGG